MLILGIETSCDETAISLLEYSGGAKPLFTVRANNVLSQIDIHKEFGGVFPMMAKREHAKNIIPILEKTLQKNKLLQKEKVAFSKSKVEKIRKILEREPGLFDIFIKFIPALVIFPLHQPEDFSIKPDFVGYLFRLKPF